MSHSNDAQRDFWSSAVGRKWVANQPRLDALFTEVNDSLLALASPTEGEHVLDVGTGAGDLALQMSDAVGETGHVLGLDIAKPLLARARERAEARDNITLMLADAQDHEFDEDRFDLLASRFGLMFFSDPVAGFSNLRSALRPGARMAFAAWAPQEENPWSVLPRRVAVERLGDPPPDTPQAPGQFAFADSAYVERILSEAGFSGVEGGPFDLHLHAGRSPEEAADLACSIGPVSRIMRDFEGTDDDLKAITEDVARAFEQFAGVGGIRVPARITLYSAQNP